MGRYPVIAFILIFSLGVLLIAYVKRQQDAVETFHVSATTEDEVKDELIIAVFIESITKM